MPREPRDHHIPLQAAAALTRRFGQGATKGAVFAQLFGREALEELLAQPGCAGVRIYYGLKDGGEPAVVRVGVDPADRDLTNGAILEEAYPCPPFCGAANG
jgi:hypothetical protein